MVEEFKEFLDKGIENIRLGNYKDAIELINKSIKLKDNWEIPYFYRAVAYHMLEDNNEAILDYTKAIKINPKMTDAYYNRAKIMLESNDKNINLNQVVSDLNKALELDENFIDALFAMAAVQKRLEEYNLALEYLDRLLLLQPDSVNARAFKKLLLQKYIK